jgi:hypothetical protein
MKKLMVVIVGLFIVSGSFSAVLADQPKDPGREIINLKMGVVDLRFQHWKHQSNVHNACFNCHKTKIGVIDGWDKEVAHKICIPCHDLESKGPVQCHECHVK